MAEPQIMTIEAPALVVAPPDAPRAGVTIATSEQHAILPTTTHEEQLVTAGQRGINKLWESTQTGVSLIVTVGIVIICIMLVHTHDMAQIALGLTTINVAFVMIIQSYFTRTNHTKTGGVGSHQDGR